MARIDSTSGLLPASALDSGAAPRRQAAKQINLCCGSWQKLGPNAIPSSNRLDAMTRIESALSMRPERLMRRGRQRATLILLAALTIYAVGCATPPRELAVATPIPCPVPPMIPRELMARPAQDPAWFYGSLESIWMPLSVTPQPALRLRSTSLIGAPGPDPMKAGASQ